MSECEQFYLKSISSWQSGVGKGGGCGWGNSLYQSSETASDPYANWSSYEHHTCTVQLELYESTIH